MKFVRCLPFVFLLFVLFAPQALGFHVPPWDSGHNSFEPDPGDKKTDPGTGDGCKNCICTTKTKSPVEVASGNFIYIAQILYISGIGPAIDITLTYNSHDSRRGPFGVGWIHPYEQRIVETTDEVNIYAICTQANGKRERFTKNLDGSYTPPPHVADQLVKNLDNTFTLRNKHGLVRQFNQQGFLTASVDRNGNTLRFSYDPAGFMTQITDASGRAVTFTKGGNGKVASLTDPDNRTIRFSYGASGSLIGYVDPLGNVTTYQYDSTNNFTALIDPRGNTLTRVIYDGEGRVSQYIDGAETWSYSYSPSTKRTTKRSSQGNTWTFDYNDNGNVIKIVDPLNNTEIYALDTSFNVTQYMGKNGNTAKYTYDSIGNNLTLIDSLNGVRTMTYEPIFNRPLAIRDAIGNTARFEYDSKGNLAKATNAIGHITQYQHDGKGQLIRITGALGQSYDFTYDSYGNLIRATNSSGNTSTATHDILGRIITSADAEGRATQFVYDGNDRLVRAVNAVGGTTSNEYDASGNLTAITIPSGARTAFQYDSLNRLVRTTNSLGQSTSYTYDRRDNLASKTDAKGQGVTYSYDPLDRLTRRAKQDGVVSYSYDAVGNLLNVADNDSNLSFVYDALNRVTESRTAATVGQPSTAIRFSYNANGNRLTMTDPSGGTTNYSYDALQRLVSLTNPSGEQFKFTYDELSRRSRVDRPFGLATTYAYDPVSRLISLVHQGGAGIAQFNYTYDRAGNRTTKTDATGLYSYTYDSLYRLTGVSSPTGNPPESYTYDSVGNRTMSRGNTLYTYDAANRLVSDTAFEYIYDANGNLTRKTERAMGKATNYTYNSENQLIRIVFSDGTNATYRYDGIGRRIEKNVNGQITRHIYDGQDILFEYIGTTLSARYTHGPGIDEMLSVSRGGSTWLFQADAIGSITSLVDSVGVKAAYQYDAFGRILSQTGTAVTPYRFQGREFDSESGLYYYRARYYDPLVGRFISQDPIRFAGGLNFYRFVGNNPVLFRDPMGKDASAATWVFTTAGGLSILDGPLPVGEILGGTLIVGATIYYGPTLWQQASQVFNKDESADSEGEAEDVGSCPVPEDLKGKSPEEIDEMMKERGWPGNPTREGEGTGTRYPNPKKPGEQVRVMPGKPTDPNPIKQGPYGRISSDGRISDPIPLKGNPTLKK